MSSSSKKAVEKKTSPKKRRSVVKSKYHPLDGQWGWMIVFGASLGHFFLVGLARTLGMFFVHWVDRFEGTAAATAWVQSLFNTVRMIIGPFVSILCNTFGSRIVVMIGGFIFGVGCLVSAFATSLEFLYLSFSLLAGLGAGLIFTPMFVMVNQYFDKKKGIAMALATIGSGLGTMVLAPLETLLLHEFGHFGSMLIIAGLMFNCMVVGALFRPLESKINWPKQKPESVIEMEIIGGRDGKDEKDMVKGTTKVCEEDGDEEEIKPLAKYHDDELDVKIDSEGIVVVPSRSIEINICKCGSNDDVNTNSSAQCDEENKDGSDDEKQSPCDQRTVSQVSQTDAEKHSPKSHSSKAAQEIHETASLRKSTSSMLQPESKWADCKTKFAFLKSATFWVYSFYMAALPCAIQIYMVYTPSLMKERGYSDSQAALVISIAGASDIAGRFIAGFLFDLKFIRQRRWPAHTMYGFVVGIIILFNAFQHHLVGFIAVALLWGIFEGGYHGQRATIVSEFIKQEQVANSVGFMIFWQGVGNMLSPTFAGFLKDQFGTYAVSFYYGGTAMMFCALVFFFNYLIVKCKCIQSKKTTKTENPHVRCNAP